MRPREVRGGLVRVRKPRRKFNRDFKLEAVRRVIEGEETVTGVAQDLGINRSTLSRWKRELGPSLQSLPATAPQPWVSVVFDFADNAAAQPHWPPSSAQPEVTLDAQTVLVHGLGRLEHPGDALGPANVIRAPSPTERRPSLGREHGLLRTALRGESEPPDWPVLLADRSAQANQRDPPAAG
jgi:transposase-like protein